VRLVDEDHEPRAGGGQAPDPLHEGDPQLDLVDAPVGLADLGLDRLPEGAAGFPVPGCPTTIEIPSARRMARSVSCSAASMTFAGW